ncbi:MAG: hypothetical protein JWR70_1016, partial [Modestobacter sp.]|nr:hypothetical protein [Modestobacter sp.]
MRARVGRSAGDDQQLAAAARGDRPEGDGVANNAARVKSVEESIRDTEEPEHQLKKNLSAL